MLSTPDRSSSQIHTPPFVCTDRLRRGLTLIAAAWMLSACGGADSEKPEPISDAEAVRFLEQASFGPTSQDISRLQSLGYARWIDEQLSLNSTLPNHLATVDAIATARGATKPDGNDVTHSWWTHAIRDNAQLRQRVAFALSQIFVVSTAGDLGGEGRTIASYMDMLARNSTESYRQLIEDVAMHPAMGAYLSHRGNRKEDPTSGRVPDENFAREVMQLFSIGLYELNPDGTVKLTNGRPTETYTSNDVKGLAKVFTGFSWNWPAANSGLMWWKCFWRVQECRDPNQETSSMSGYAQEHSVSAKDFLGVSIPAQGTANPQLSLKLALDRLATHPNTAPFISKQLIQRLVASNPSDAYVRDIAAVFTTTGGDLGQVVKAILLHDEARDRTEEPTAGKLREPVLRVAHLMRALPHTSDTYATQLSQGRTGYYPIGETDNPASALGQTPMRAPSVFNFFRPGYKPPQSELGSRDLVSPEMQITTETTVIGYANFVSTILNSGWGKWNSGNSQYDVRFDLGEFDALVGKPDELIDAVSKKVLRDTLPTDTRSTAITALTAMPTSTATQRRRVIQAAILMTAVSPDFITQD